MTTKPRASQSEYILSVCAIINAIALASSSADAHHPVCIVLERVQKFQCSFTAWPGTMEEKRMGFDDNHIGRDKPPPLSLGNGEKFRARMWFSSFSTMSA